MGYTIQEHIHNYAVWTAARAVQRNFTDTLTIKNAINNTELKSYIDYKNEITKVQFDEFHRNTASIIINSICKEKKICTSYGQAAKIIAIYLKTAVIIRDEKCPLAKIAHPPIDSILLSALNQKYPDFNLNGITWTKLDHNSYFTIIEKLRTLNLEYFWQIENSWDPSPKDKSK